MNQHLNSTSTQPSAQTSAQPTGEQTGLVALVIDTPHGTNVTVHRTREGALAKVDQFVSEWWDTEMGEDDPMPADPAVARQAYFENVGTESYVIEDDITIVD